MTTPSKYDTYASPLAERNASPAMLRLWSPRHKFNTWRRIWLAVAESQHEITKGWGKQPERERGPGQTTAAGAAPKEPSLTVGLHAPLVTKEQVEELRAVVNRKNPDGSMGITDDEIRLAEKYERELRHDVMAHVHALGDVCPKAKGIIHLGMTSQDVVCNADMLVLRETSSLLSTKLARLVLAFGDSAATLATIPSLGFTHYQPAQPVTCGRRIAVWAHDLELCLDQLSHTRTQLSLKGLKGATGTQASFLSLFSDPPKLTREQIARVKLEDCFSSWKPAVAAAYPERHAQEIRVLTQAIRAFPMTRATEFADAKPEDIAKYAGGQSQGSAIGLIKEFLEHLARCRLMLDGSSPISSPGRSVQLMEGHATWVLASGSQTRADEFQLTTQTYPRVIDTFILADLASVASVLHKIATDIRLLSNRKELDEPFENKQIGSSAMPYKRNPMRCERICGLSRFVMNLVGNAYDTAATQWLERTLDDSSNRRLSLPEAFLALDGALDLMHNVASGLIVHEAMVKKNLLAELPFMATENILMATVKLGGDRQHYHELIRVHAQAAGMRVKQEGLDNDLIDRLRGDKNFWSTARGGPLREELDWDGLMDPMKYVGRSVEQTERFIKEVVEPLREQYGDQIAKLEESGPRV